MFIALCRTRSRLRRVHVKTTLAVCGSSTDFVTMDMIYGISNAVVSLLPKQSDVAEQMKEIMLSNAPGTNFVRLAGISGALAVGMAAIGAHGK